MRAGRGKFGARAMVQSALFAALLSILSPLAIPIGTIPVTLAVFAVLLTGVVLPWKRAAGAVLVYLLMGLIGLPVFSGGKAGAGVLLGATGGYLWSYLPMTALTSIMSQRGEAGAGRAFMASMLALLLCYATGTMQFAWLTGCSWGQALSVCVAPFAAFDLLKAAAAVWLGGRLRRSLKAAGMLE